MFASTIRNAYHLRICLIDKERLEDLTASPEGLLTLIIAVKEQNIVYDEPSSDGAR